MTENMFSRIIIVGVGLLGGSVGLAVKNRGLAETVLGVGRSRSSIDAALKYGVIDDGLTDLDHIPFEPGRTTLAVVCTPVGDIPKSVRRILERFSNEINLLVTDVGSTKAKLCREIDDPRFIGSHPIAGSQQSGPEAARGDLFEGRLTVITPGTEHSRNDIDALRRFWMSLGSDVVEMDTEHHDKILAVTSHLPHLVSVALASTLEDEERSFTGTGYADMTRLAAGAPEVWRDIMLANDANILDALRRFRDRLSEWTEILESGDAAKIEALLRKGAAETVRPGP